MKFLRATQIVATRQGLSQEKLAHLAGIDRTYVSSLERCIYSPTIDMVATLAEILEVAPADLLRQITKICNLSIPGPGRRVSSSSGTAWGTT